MVQNVILLILDLLRLDDEALRRTGEVRVNALRCQRRATGEPDF
jgi:hypothetical protein